MLPRPQPSVNFHARIDLITEERRRRLQAQTGFSAPRLVGEALRIYEEQIDAGRVTPPSTA